MRVIAILTACAAAVALSACSTTTTGQMLNNLQGCERHYDGAVSAGMTGGQFSGTVKVDCVPEAAKVGTIVPAAASPSPS